MQDYGFTFVENNDEKIVKLNELNLRSQNLDSLIQFKEQSFDLIISNSVF